MVRAAEEVDHIVAVSADLSLGFERTNLQSLCRRCHQKKTANENSTISDKEIREREKWDESFRNEYHSD